MTVLEYRDDTWGDRTNESGSFPFPFADREYSFISANDNEPAQTHTSMAIRLEYSII